MEKGKPWAWLVNGSAQYVGVNWKWMLSHERPSQKGRNERKSSQWAKLQAAHLVIHFEKRKKWTPHYSLLGWGKWIHGLVMGLEEVRFNDWGHQGWSNNCHWMYDLSPTGTSTMPSIQETSQPLGPAEVLWSRAIRVQSRGGRLWVSVKAWLSPTAGTLGSTVSFPWIMTTSGLP